MFSNGKFKNIVALIDDKDEFPLLPGGSLSKTYTLSPTKGVPKNWIALEDSYVKTSPTLASTVMCNSSEERNVFAIYVSYYVKVQLIVGTIRNKISVKLPFTLMPSQIDADLIEHYSQHHSPIQTLTTEDMQIEGNSSQATIEKENNLQS